jgi:branched-subunit amino acid aminotransferase/4-amino-4-deoxychorismate lyase
LGDRALIWTGGRIVADDELKISVLDRTFEHGLGLFETFRTWNGHSTLLDRHLERLQRSAWELGLPLDPSQLPDEGAVANLLRAEGGAGDVMLRITMSGGRTGQRGSVVWMRSADLPPPMTGRGAVIKSTWDVLFDDPLAKYKGLNYWGRRLAYEAAQERGEDETLSRSQRGSQRGLIWEGSRTNLFLVFGETVATPSTIGPIVPGIMRGLVLERAQKLGFETPEWWVAARREFRTASEAFLTNSVRGIIPIQRAWSRRFPEMPGPITRRIWDDVRAWLERGGIGQ